MKMDRDSLPATVLVSQDAAPIVAGMAHMFPTPIELIEISALLKNKCSSLAILSVWGAGSINIFIYFVFVLFYIYMLDDHNIYIYSAVFIVKA